MADCLMARFLAISASNAPSSTSTSDNASAISRCSAGCGNGTWLASKSGVGIRFVPWVASVERRSSVA